MAISTLRASLLTLAGGLLLAAPARADWTEYGGGPEHQLFTTEKVQAPLGVLWKHATTVYAEKIGNKGGPLVSGDLVFFPSKTRIYAVDFETGELAWRAPEGDLNDPKIPNITATPATNGEFLFVPDGAGFMTAYSATDGQEVWRFRTGATIRSSPTLVGDFLFFGSDDDFVYCVDARTGNLQWKSNDKGKSFPLSDDAVGSPAYHNGVIYINSADLKMWAIQADTGRVMWLQRLIAPSVDISPVASNGRIYLAAGSTIYQFRLRGGNYRAYPLQEWVENDITTTPIITEKYWYVGDRDGMFHAFTNTGRPVMKTDGKPWRVKLEGRPQGTPIMTPDSIYVTTDKGFVYAIDIVSGDVSWLYRTEAPKGITPLYAYYPIRAPLAISKGRVFVVGDDGTLTCLAANAPDDEGPMITVPRPSRGAVMNGAPPITLAAYMWDEGSGINPETVEVLLNGKPIEPDPKPYNERPTEPRTGWIYDPVKRLVRFTTPKGEKDQPEPSLLNGRQKVQIQAADWKGNFSSLEWTFVVDNSLPRQAVLAKPKTNNGQPGGLGGYPGAPGGEMGGYPGAGGGAPGAPGGRGNVLRGRSGAYQYNNRGRAGYGFGNGNRGGMGGPGMGAPGGRGRGGFSR
ncbi:MAG: PQQ-binding-like beta-propeller repeat protein [Actinomycetota bacterium]